MQNEFIFFSFKMNQASGVSAGWKYDEILLESNFFSFSGQLSRVDSL
jgi:hypothetical protein